MSKEGYTRKPDKLCSSNMFEVDEKEIYVFGNEWRVRIVSVTASRTK